MVNETFSVIFKHCDWLELFIVDDCNCHPNGTETNRCDASGQCHCKCDIQGLKCTECTDFHFGFPFCNHTENCKKNSFEYPSIFQYFSVVCACDPKGSTSLICNKTDGNCSCKPNIHGRQCDKCQDGFKLHPNCTGTSFDVCIFLLTNLMYSVCGCDTQGSNGTACSTTQIRCYTTKNSINSTVNWVVSINSKRAQKQEQYAQSV